ncbi:MAG: GntR family transcriptional regulator, partial [Rubrivivax sp.]|nr:GntR family transcriptional regulator [Rubrivivax sp.]
MRALIGADLFGRPPRVAGLAADRTIYTIDIANPGRMAAPPTRTIAHRTLASAIAERLRQSILGGERAAGSQLRQDALAAEFGVSRIPVREALFQLEAEGLVRIEPHKGALVAGFALPEIDDVFDLRVLLEPRLLARSVPRLEPADYAEIDDLDAAFAEAIARHDVAQWGELNARLHLSLY